MNPFQRIWRHLRALGQAKAVKQEIDDELKFHLEQRVAENIAAGMSLAEATRDARKRFGNFQSVREECRERRGGQWLETTWQDVRYGLRRLRKSPIFTLVAIATLALGIGANTAIFSAVDKLLVRPLPVAAPEGLALLARDASGGQPDYEFTYPLFRDYQRENTVFSELTALGVQAVGVTTRTATERQQALLVSGNYFRMLGVEAALGRTFAADEGVEVDDVPVAVLSHGLWQRGFGADPQIVGQNLIINGSSFTVIGVAPRHFTGTERGQTPDLYLPITSYARLSPARIGNDHPLRTRYFVWHKIMGRLRAGVTFPQAESAMQGLARQIQAVNPANVSTNLAVYPGAQGFAGAARQARLPLNLLLGTAGLVLLIACANIASLQLARASGRTRDFAIRLALGADRGRLIRELFTESVVLALAGGVAGVVVAFWLGGVIQHFQPPGLGSVSALGLDVRVLLFALGASLLAGVLFGLWPAWSTTRLSLLPRLKDGGAATEPRVGAWNARGALVIFQVALSLVVLVGAGLCLRSLQKLEQVDPGYAPSQVVMASFDLRLNGYTDERAVDFYQQLLARVRTLPGVEAAGLGLTTPLDGSSIGMSVERIEDYVHEGRGKPVAEYSTVSSDYFRTFGISLLQGRDFDSSDLTAGANTIIVNEAFVMRYWPNQSPLGKQVFQHGEVAPATVVGVVKATRTRGLDRDPRPAMYFPLGRRKEAGLTLAVRTGLSPAATVANIRGLVKSLDANVPAFRIRTLEQQRDGGLALQRMTATLLAGFGVITLLLAALGIYGLLAHSVSRRTREIGLRMALGAEVGSVIRLILRQGLGLASVGMLVGLGAALASTRVLRSFLYEVQPLDPLTFGSVLLLLFSVALLACWFPARRAAKVEPMVALRHE